jgi:hypothetical protein
MMMSRRAILQSASTQRNRTTRTTQKANPISALLRHQRQQQRQQHVQQCQSFSTSSNSPPNMQYEYPTRTEVPTITRTVASTLKDTDTPSSAAPSNKTRAHDYFEDLNSLKEHQSVLKQQKTRLNTQLPNSFQIATTPPASIPRNLPTHTMSTPTTKLSTLDNGLRVASQETYGQVCTFGLLSNCGSRYEDPAHRGINHLMELLAFCGTKQFDSTVFQNTLDTLGGISFASSSKEQFLYCIDVLRPNVDQAMDMLQQAILHPHLNDDIVNDMKRVIEFQWMDIMPEVLLSEGLQFAAYAGPDNQLGKPHFCKSRVVCEQTNTNNTNNAMRP